jgi:hypothetical protein
MYLTCPQATRCGPTQLQTSVGWSHKRRACVCVCVHGPMTLAKLTATSRLQNVADSCSPYWRTYVYVWRANVVWDTIYNWINLRTYREVYLPDRLTFDVVHVLFNLRKLRPIHALLLSMWILTDIFYCGDNILAQMHALEPTASNVIFYFTI